MLLHGDSFERAPSIELGSAIERFVPAADGDWANSQPAITTDLAYRISYLYFSLNLSIQISNLVNNRGLEGHTRTARCRRVSGTRTTNKDGISFWRKTGLESGVVFTCDNHGFSAWLFVLS